MIDHAALGDVPCWIDRTAVSLDRITEEAGKLETAMHRISANVGRLQTDVDEVRAVTHSRQTRTPDRNARGLRPTRQARDGHRGARGPALRPTYADGASGERAKAERRRQPTSEGASENSAGRRLRRAQATRRRPGPRAGFALVGAVAAPSSGLSRDSSGQESTAHGPGLRERSDSASASARGDPGCRCDLLISEYRACRAGCSGALPMHHVLCESARSAAASALNGATARAR